MPFFLLGSSIHPSFHPKFLVQNEESRSQTEDDSGEGTRLLNDHEGDPDHGEPINRSELDQILHGQSSNNDISDEMRDQLLGDELSKDWGRGRVSVYDEGSCLVICDEEGEFELFVIIRHLVLDIDGRKQGMYQLGRFGNQRAVVVVVVMSDGDDRIRIMLCSRVRSSVW